MASSHRPIHRPDGWPALAFSWTKINFYQVGKVCVGHMMINRARILIIRDLIAIEIAITGVSETVS